MSDAWVQHVKKTQKYYESQGHPISYHQALQIAKASWEKQKKGEKVEQNILPKEEIPKHNTKPRAAAKKELAPPPPTLKAKARPLPRREEYDEYVDYEDPPRYVPQRKPRPPREYDDYGDYEDYYPPPRSRPPRTRPPPRYEYEEGY